MKKWVKYRWPVALSLIVVAGLGVAFWPRALAVESVQVSTGPMRVTIDDDAVTRIKEVYTVTTPVAGRVLRINHHAGDAVVAGETVLFSILPMQAGFLDSRTQKEREAARTAALAAREAARAGLDGAQAVLDNARLEFRRATELFNKKVVARARVDQSERELRTAQSAVAVANSTLSQREAELAQAEATLLSPEDSAASQTLKNLEIKAPESGKILSILQENENVIGSGTPIMEIGNPARLEIVADLLSRDALKIAAGDKVIIDNWGGEGFLNGAVRLIEAAGVTKISSLGIEEQRVNVIIDLTDPPEKWAALGHGYQVDVHVAIWQKEDALRAPIGALFRKGDHWAVFRIEGGRARLRSIQVGHMSAQFVEVLEGVAPGDRIVLYPTDRITEGVKIRGSEVAVAEK